MKLQSKVKAFWPPLFGIKTEQQAEFAIKQSLFIFTLLASGGFAVVSTMFSSPLNMLVYAIIPYLLIILLLFYESRLVAVVSLIYALCIILTGGNFIYGLFALFAALKAVEATIKYPPKSYMNTNFSENTIHVSKRSFKFAKADQALLLSILFPSLGLACIAMLFVPFPPITAVAIGVINGIILFTLVDKNKKTQSSAPNPLMVILCAVLMASLVYMGAHALMWLVLKDLQPLPAQFMAGSRDVFGLQRWMDNWLWLQLLLELSIIITISSLMGMWRLKRRVVVRVFHDEYPAGW